MPYFTLGRSAVMNILNWLGISSTTTQSHHLQYCHISGSFFLYQISWMWGRSGCDQISCKCKIKLKQVRSPNCLVLNRTLSLYRRPDDFGLSPEVLSVNFAPFWFLLIFLNAPKFVRTTCASVFFKSIYLVVSLLACFSFCTCGFSISNSFNLLPTLLLELEYFTA